MRDGRTLYLVKWRDLSYDQATWEEENESILGLKQAIDFYMVSHLWNIFLFLFKINLTLVNILEKQSVIFHHYVLSQLCVYHVRWACQSIKIRN
jgi:hypothetical protein